jgi:hypothetical protein
MKNHDRDVTLVSRAPWLAGAVLLATGAVACGGDGEAQCELRVPDVSVLPAAGQMLKVVAVTGPCSVTFQSAEQAGVYGTGAGRCHIEAETISGFKQARDVQLVRRVEPTCGDYFAPTDPVDSHFTVGPAP